MKVDAKSFCFQQNNCYPYADEEIVKRTYIKFTCTVPVYEGYIHSKIHHTSLHAEIKCVHCFESILS